MPSKTYKMPEKIANLPAEKFADVAQNPGGYGLTVFEYTEFLRYITTIGMTANTNVDNHEIMKLKSEIRILEEENDKLRRRINTMREWFDEIETDIDSYREMFMED